MGRLAVQSIRLTDRRSFLRAPDGRFVAWIKATDGFLFPVEGDFGSETDAYGAGVMALRHDEETLESWVGGEVFVVGWVPGRALCVD
jgi:hypothetical protein